MSVGELGLMRIKAESHIWHLRMQCCQGDRLAWVSALETPHLGSPSVLDELGWMVGHLGIASLPKPNSSSVQIFGCI